jgi:hypothetical protein
VELSYIKEDNLNWLSLWVVVGGGSDDFDGTAK